MPFTTKCPATVMVEGDADAHETLTTLRDYRDAILTSTPRGQRYTELFYKHAPEALWLMTTDSGLRTQSRAALQQFLPAIRSALTGLDYQMTWDDRIALHGLINDFAAKGSAKFRRDLRAVQGEMWQPQVWWELLGSTEANRW